MDEILIQKQAAKVKNTSKALENPGYAMAGLADLANHIPGGAFVCLDDGCMTFLTMGKSFLKAFGYPGKRAPRQYQEGLMGMVVPKDREQVKETIAEGCVEDGFIETECRIKKETGSAFWVQVKLTPGMSEDGSRVFYGIMNDITRQKTEREELCLSLKRYEMAISQSRDIVFEWDMAADTFTCSPNWAKRFGYDVTGKDLSKQIACPSYIHPNDMHICRKLMDDMAAGQPYREAEFRIRDIMGNDIWCRVRAMPQFSVSGLPVKAAGVIFTLEEEKKRHLKLLDYSRRDSLTGLLNKNAVKLQVQRWLEILKKRGAMFIMDLDGLKAINDSFGHLCGDAVLCEAAGKLKKQFRSDDAAGRIGGDEFLVYIPDVTEKRAIEMAANLSEAFLDIQVNGQKGMVRCSMGIAFCPEHGSDFYELYRHANEAVSYVKNHEKGSFAIYGEAMEKPGEVRKIEGQFIGSAIDSAADEDSIQLAQYSFRMLHGAADIKKAVGQLLGIIGKACDLSHIYIFENTQDNAYCSCTFEWCREGIPAKRDVWQNLSYERDLKGLLELYHGQEVLYFPSRKEMPGNLDQLLSGQNMCAILHCAIIEDGEFWGFVGYEEWQEKRIFSREQAEALTMTANVLSTFLVKQRLKESRKTTG